MSPRNQTPNLSAVVDQAQAPAKRPRPALKSRKPTGKPSWPLILLAGAEKAGKSYSAAQASASKYIGRTFWIGAGEEDPDEYGAIPGARFEILEHDGTYWDILGQLEAAVAEPREHPAVPNMIVFDSGSRFWDMLSDEAQALANARKRGGGLDDAPIGMDLWNRATARWHAVMNVLRKHDGPVIITARLETVTVMDDNGRPTPGRQEKVKGQKGLPFDVGVVIQMPRRGETYLTGVRSLQIDVPVESKLKINNFQLEKLWIDLGVTDPAAVSARSHSDVNGEKSALERPDWKALYSDAQGDPAALTDLRAKAVDAGLPETFGLFKAIDDRLAQLATIEDQPATQEASA